jgi:large subunit ribosomal protein L30
VSEKVLHVTYVKSCIGYPERQKRTLRALGLKRLGDRVEVPETDAVKGMLERVSHLVDIIDTRSQEEG